MSTSKENENGRLSAYSAPVLKVYGEVARLTASGTQGGTENPFNGDPQPRDKP